MEKYNYTLEVGDVVLVQNGGWGISQEDEGKYVEVISKYFDSDDGRTVFGVKSYDQELKNDYYTSVWIQTFGESPMILLNVNEEHVVDEKYTNVAKGSKAEVDKALGISRSALDKRKNGKIRMELVDQGFPLALMELGRVMTWANENKGYLDHDWKQLPDAENGFKGAAARHRVKFDAQRAFGNEMLDCVDEESGIIHLAHEAFNILALLELALAGKVK